MKASDLVAEGQRLAKPCIYLRAAGEGEPVAAWEGSPGVLAPHRGARHWVTLNCEALPKEFGLGRGAASVFSDEGTGDGGSFVIDADARFKPGSGSIPLFAHAGVSLPPLDAIFRFGSPPIKAWLAKNKWEPTWAYNDNFKDRATAEAYDIAFQKQCPLYTGDAHAVLGGWHFPWPDDDWVTRLNDRLLLWTFEAAEPWIEVWLNDGVFEVMQRIT